MASVYSKSFFYDSVAPGTPVSFMTGAVGETWILRSILMTNATSGFGWSINITDSAGNLIYQSGIQSVNTLAVENLRIVLMPSTSYTISAGTDTVFVAAGGYVLSS